MANTSYLDLTNKLLRRLNEVEMESSDFASARGVQAMAKDAINASIAKINNQHFEWPFNSYAGKTQLLTVGTNQYTFPADLKSVDWNSFRIQKDDTLGTNTKHLKFVSKDYWEDFFKDLDFDAGVTGVNIPLFVFKGQNFGFGVTPSPNKAYTVIFDYFKLFTPLSLYTDVSTIPSNYDEVIIQGGLYHFYMFRDNDTQAVAADKEFDKQIRFMTNILGNPDDRMLTTMIDSGGPSYAPVYSGGSGD
jgi:hypothetical protein